MVQWMRSSVDRAEFYQLCEKGVIPKAAEEL
jgi:hypothetical protein